MASENSTDKPIIESHGLGLYRLEAKHIMPLHDDLSAENLRELEQVYDIDPLSALLDVLREQMTFVVERKGKPLAVTGIDQNGIMWAMFTESMKKNWIRFARASGDLVKFYHNFYDEIYCQVWSENEMILQWLSHLGFEIQFIHDIGDIKMVQFVRCKSEQTNVYSLLSRPVMH